MMGMNKKRKKSGMSMDKGMKMAKSTKKGMAGDDMMSMDSKPVKKMGGGMMGYAKGGSVTTCTPRGNGAARSNTCKIC
jgi:hypothetical protein